MSMADDDELADIQSRLDDEWAHVPGQAKNIELLDDEPAWKMQGGMVVKVENMSDNHLRNTIGMLRRMHDTRIMNYGIVAGHNGSMEGAVKECDLSGPEFTTHRVYPRLMEEALSRGLTIPHGAPELPPPAKRSFAEMACPGRDAEPGAPHKYEGDECIFCKGGRP